MKQLKIDDKTRTIMFTFFLSLFSSSTNKKKRNLFDKKHVIWFIKKFMPLIGVIILIYIIVDVGVGDIAATFFRISPFFLVLAALLTIPRILLRNVQWQLILKKQKIYVSYLKSFKIFLIGYFYGAVTPGYMGGLIRVPYLKDETDEPVGKLFVNVFVLSVVNTLTLYFLSIVGAFIIASQSLPKDFPIKPDYIPIIACLIAAIQLFICFYFIDKKRGMKVLNFLVKLTIKKRLQNFFRGFVETFYNDFPKLRDFIIPILIGLPCWFIMYSQIYLLGLPLGIDQVPYLHFIMLYAIANIISFIPITSGGLGLRELVLITLFNSYGVNAEVAIVIGLAGHFITDVLTGVYGLIIAFIEARNNKKDLSDVDVLLEEKK